MPDPAQSPSAQADEARGAGLPDLASPALAFAERVGLAPNDKDKETFAQSFLGRLMGQASLLVKSVVTYVVSLAALYGITWWLFKVDLLFLMKEWRPWPQIALLVLPALIVGLPLSLDVVVRRRDRKLRRRALATDQYRPGYFRLEPYEAADGATFTRSDGIHEKVLGWLADDRPPTFRYLTGASGSGKTSLLQAFVLPKLRAQGWVVLSLRAREDGVARLTEELRSDGAVWKNPPEVTEPRELLERAAATLRRGDKRLLLLVDQFEELYILESEAELGRMDEKTAAEQAAARERFVSLLRSLAEQPIEGLVVLLSMRKDYEDKVVERYCLPAIRQGENRRMAELFDVPAAVSFLRGSGTLLNDDVLRDLLEGAGRVEDQPGLFRPVLLNLVGLQLVHSQGTLPCPADRIISHYLMSSLRRRNLRDVARLLLEPLVSDQGSALAMSLARLAAITRKSRLEIKGMMRVLRDDGLVRPLDTSEEIWQVAHDFLARQIGLLLGRLRRPWWQRAVLWTAPVLGVALVGLLWVGLPLWSRVEALRELRELGASSWERNGAVQVAYIYKKPGDFRRVVSAMQVVGANSLDLTVTEIEEVRPLLEVRRLTHLGLAVRNADNLGILQGLNRLEKLDLTGTHVRSLDPLRGLTQLASLSLSGTQVDNLEPLRGLTQLTYLDLLATPVDDLEPLRGLTRLTVLNLFSTKVNNLEPLSGLTRLTQLNLSFTAASDLEPLRALTHLTGLSLIGPWFNNIEPLRGLTQLTKLDLASSHVSDLEPLRGLLQLTELNLSHTEVSDIEPLRDLTRLAKLDLSSTQVGSVEPLRGLNQLAELNLFETKVSDLKPLKKLPKLTALNLIGSKH